MKRIQPILTYLFGAIMIAGGIAHFVNPAPYAGFIPDFLPKDLVNYLTGIVEIALGAGVFFPQTRTWATLGIFLLMIAFLPLHVLDVFKENPAIGSKTVAYIRLPMQFVLIAWAWYNYRQSKARTS